MSVTKCQRIKSNTSGILSALDTFHMPEREDGICLYCQQYNTELALDGCCPVDKHALPNDLTCRKARRLRAMANAEAMGRGELKMSAIDPLEGIAVMGDDGMIHWQTFAE